MQTKITLNPTGVGDISHELTGTDADIPQLHIGPVDVTFYDFHLDHGQMSAWLADLSAHALELAAQIDAKWPAASSSGSEIYECSRCGASFGIAGQHTGSDDDYAADDYFREQVEHHESGECSKVRTIGSAR